MIVRPSNNFVKEEKEKEKRKKKEKGKTNRADHG
jgi:hypothetical protein